MFGFLKYLLICLFLLESVKFGVLYKNDLEVTYAMRVHKMDLVDRLFFDIDLMNYLIVKKTHKMTDNELFYLERSFNMLKIENNN